MDGYTMADQPHSVRLFLATVRLHLGTWNVERLPYDFNLLKEEKQGNAVVAVLVGSDGSNNHAITVSNRNVFDANLSQAYPLCREVLDWCVSAGPLKCKFQCCSVAYRIKQPGKKRQRSRNRKKDEQLSVSTINEHSSQGNIMKRTQTIIDLT